MIRPKLYKKLMARGFFLVASVRKCARILKVEKRGKTCAALTKEAVALIIFSLLTVIILNWYRSNLERRTYMEHK